jgi:16S rRNA (adenine1518-N6/adenine1519-N6)-dimethyltransferase
MWNCASRRNEFVDMKHLPRKRFGQHFLTDKSVIDAIVGAINPKPSEALVEIGPGLGAMTLPLIAWSERLTVIELDRDLAQRLRSKLALNVIEADVLQVNFADIAQVHNQSLRVVGNLPYNISTPILFHLMKFVDHIVDQHFMLQKEVVDRMVASPATKDYGRLSVMLQWRYQMEAVLNVPPQAFEPPPRVNSAVVRMQPRPQPAVVAEERLSDIVRVAFSQRRKLLRHTLGLWLQQHQFAGEFDVQRRAEEVPMADYVALAQQVG